MLRRTQCEGTTRLNKKAEERPAQTPKVPSRLGKKPQSHPNQRLAVRGPRLLVRGKGSLHTVSTALQRAFKHDHVFQSRVHALGSAATYARVKFSGCERCNETCTAKK